MAKFKVGDTATFTDGWTGKVHTCEIDKVNDTTPISYDVTAWHGKSDAYGTTLDENLLKASHKPATKGRRNQA